MKILHEHVPLQPQETENFKVIGQKSTSQDRILRFFTVAR